MVVVIQLLRMLLVLFRVNHRNMQRGENARCIWGVINRVEHICRIGTGGFLQYGSTLVGSYSSGLLEAQKP